ncbi:MAG: LacI family DNA-binding transcriptional regulator [Kiritimatiellia bacterium]|nr:LacI family DNA-binding transcriptional regulator [Kiritimatiellia bacterium]
MKKTSAPAQKPLRRRSGSVGLKDVAAASGYSTATVSWALRGLACVPDATKNKVLAAAEKLGYRPDPKLTEFAAYLQRRRRHRSDSTLALITHFPVDLKTTPWLMAKGIVARAEELGYGTEVFQLDEAQGGYAPGELNRILLARNIQGLIFASMNKPTALEGFDWPQFSVVVSSHTLLQPRIHRVCHDHFQSLLLACAKLKERRYRRIGLVLDTAMDVRVNQLWRAAFLLHSDTSGEDAPPPLIEHPLTPDHLDRYIRTCRLDCLLYVGGQSRDLILSVIQKRKRLLSSDFGFAGLHIYPNEPAWAGIDQDDYHQGRALVDLTVSQILSNERGVPSHRKTILIDGIWRDGDSVRAEG